MITKRKARINKEGGASSMKGKTLEQMTDGEADWFWDRMSGKDNEDLLEIIANFITKIPKRDQIKFIKELCENFE